MDCTARARQVCVASSVVRAVRVLRALPCGAVRGVFPTGVSQVERSRYVEREVDVVWQTLAGPGQGFRSGTS